MEILAKHKKILNAEICPYCDSKTVRTTETDIYGREYSGRDVIKCKNYPVCNSYVGCHKTGEPLGRLANKELREYKVKAHKYFDQLWKDNKKQRGKYYSELSEFLGIPPEYTHIGMFSIPTLKRVIVWSKARLKGIE